MYRIVLTIKICIIALATYAQDVTVINQYNGLEPGESAEGYVLKNVTEHTYIVNEYELSNTGTRSHLEQMISYGLRSYIDNSFHAYDGRVESLVSVNDFRLAAGNIVKNAIWIHDQPFSEDFSGFSEFIDERVDRLLAVDGYQLLDGKDDKKAEDDGKMGLYTFQRMVYDLKKACELEAGFFLDQHLPRTTTRGYGDEEGDYLSTKDFRLQPMNRNLNDLRKDRPELEDIFQDEDAAGQEKARDRKKRNQNANQNSELTERVIELLEQNSRILTSYNDRFENLQKQIDEVKDNSNNEIKSEISELREMIKDLSEGKTVTEQDGSSTRILTDKSVTLIFEKNIHNLSLSQKARLNQVTATLRENPSTAAFITGYADKTGNPELNAWISKKRAEAVRDYLRTQGVVEARLIINFLGESESDSENPLDRKVTVRYLVNYSERN